MKYRNLILGSLISILLMTIGVSPAKAAHSDFSIRPLLPNNQAHEGEGFFDLVLSPNEQQTLEIELTNTSNRTINVETEIGRASTNMNGLAVYTPNLTEKDRSLRYDIEQQVKLPAETVIAPHTTTKVKVEVSMPNENLQGLIAGGITFKEKQDTVKKSDKGISIDNQYQYVIALLMRQRLDGVAPNLSLHDIIPTQVNSRNVMTANLQNSAMTYLNQMVVEAKIQGITNKNLVYHFDKSKMQMAPNSNFNLPIPISEQGALENGQHSKPMQAGKYQLNMTVYGAEDPAGAYSLVSEGKTVHYKYKWTFDKNFEITATEVGALNESDPTVPKRLAWYWWLFIVLIIFLLLNLFLFILWKKRHKEDDDQ